MQTSQFEDFPILFFLLKEMRLLLTEHWNFACGKNLFIKIYFIYLL